MAKYSVQEHEMYPISVAFWGYPFRFSQSYNKWQYTAVVQEVEHRQ